MKSLSETSVFKYTEMMASNKITSCIKNIINEKQGATFITEDKLEDVLYKMRHKSFNYIGKFAVLDLYRKGIIKLVYNERVKLTVAIPFFKYKMSDNGFGVIINLSNYAKKESDGSFKIDPTLLYVLMLTGAFSLIADKNTSLLTNNGLIDLYSELVVNVLAKCVNVDTIRKEVYKFIFAKFMLMQLGMSEDSASAFAKQDIKLDNSSIENIDLSCPIAVFKDLETLINHLRTIFQDMNNITFGLLFDKWMRSYGEATAFAIEDPIMFVMLFNALIANANNMINMKAIERNANKYSSKLVTLFNKIETIVSEMI